jgi:hypothetical protein
MGNAFKAVQRRVKRVRLTGLLARLGRTDIERSSIPARDKQQS